MSKTVVPQMVEAIVEQLNTLAQGDYSIEDMVSIYEVLTDIEVKLQELVVRDRSALPQQYEVPKRLGGCATPTMLKEDKPHYINIWKL